MSKIAIASITVLLVVLTAHSATLLIPSQYPTIQAGIDAAVSGDTVLVANGTYTGAGNKDLDFGGREIVVMSENGPENCIIDCQNDARGFYFHSNETSNSVVDGFTIINGLVNYYSTPYYKGAGIYCGDSSPTITRCHILDCYASGGG